MRMVLSLAIASVVGSTMIGGLKAYIGSGRPAPITLVQLYKANPAKVMPLVIEAVPLCFPELSKMQSRQGRQILPKVVEKVLEMKARPSTGDEKAEMRAWLEQNLLATFSSLSKPDEAILYDVVAKTIKDKNPILCIGAHVMQYVHVSRQAGPLLSDTKLRGS